MIKELALQAEQLRGKQEQAAAAAEAAGSLLEEKQKNAGESFEHLRSRAKEVLDLEEIRADFLEQMKGEFLHQSKKMEAEGRQFQKEVNEYQMLLSALTKAESRKSNFRSSLSSPQKKQQMPKPLWSEAVCAETWKEQKLPESPKHSGVCKSRYRQKGKRCTCHAGRGETAKSTGTGKPGTDLNCKV